MPLVAVAAMIILTVVWSASEPYKGTVPVVAEANRGVNWGINWGASWGEKGAAVGGAYPLRKWSNKGTRIGYVDAVPVNPHVFVYQDGRWITNPKMSKRGEWLRHPRRRHDLDR